MAIITLTTDFGTRDHYVAALKGALLSICPSARLIDVTHEIPAQDITTAAFLLPQVAVQFPKNTIHLVVVDPDVGSERRLLAGHYEGQHVVCPDNGTISLMERRYQRGALVELTEARYWKQPVSRTFHGRDIMAPVAAHLASGVNLEKLGPAIDQVEMLSIGGEPEIALHHVRGEVVHIDRFGNLISNIQRHHLKTFGANAKFTVTLGEKQIGPIMNGYWQAASNQTLALLGSSGYLEVAVNRGSAAKQLSAQCGSGVEVVVDS